MKYMLLVRPVKRNSVAYISDGELRGLMEAFIDGGVPEQEAFLAINALGIANRAAFIMQYGVGREMAPDAMERSMRMPDIHNAEPDRHLSEVFTLKDWARNLLYNCVTNAGTDFAPVVYAEQVRAWSEGKTATQAEPWAGGGWE